MTPHAIKEVYTTSSPPRLAQMFVGRRSELSRGADLIANTEKHLLVTGQRGIGKTSFCAEIVRQLAEMTGLRCQVHRLVAHKEATADSFFSDLLSAIGVRSVVTEEKTGVKGEGGIGVPGFRSQAGINRERTSKSLEFDPLSPNQILGAIARVQGHHVVVIDEFDLFARAKNGPDITSRLMQLVKAASDSASSLSSVRFIFAGLTHHAAAIMGRHESISRYISEIQLRRIPREECLRFYENAEALSGIVFEPLVRGTIVDASNGYPYFLQEVGSQCSRAAQRDNSSTVEARHFAQGIEQAREEVERANNVRFYDQYAALPDVQREVLHYVASRRTVEVPIAAILKEVALLDNHWTRSVIEQALAALMRADLFLYRAEDRGVVGFVEPFFQSYLQSRLRSHRPSKLASQRDSQLSFLPAPSDADAPKTRGRRTR